MQKREGERENTKRKERVVESAARRSKELVAVLSFIALGSPQSRIVRLLTLLQGALYGLIARAARGLRA